ncbi:hypothetical protein QTP86_026441 [Hemibagrus guttatus]|nr:hypothetical protein QTP86_026441 [Hemibagrus guttatus]
MMSVITSRLSKQQEMTLSSLLGHAKLSLLFKASVHGYNSNSFHQKCDRQGSTVTVAYNNSGYIFGAFTSRDYAQTGQNIADDKAFLFSFNTNVVDQAPLRVVSTEPQQAFIDGNTGPNFVSLLFMHNNTAVVYSNPGTYPFNPEQMYGNDLQLMECEVYRVEGCGQLMEKPWRNVEWSLEETGRKVLGVSSGRRKEDKETWWWNEEVQDSIQRKRLAKKKWDMDRTEENRQEYKELQRRVKREVSKAKQKAYDELYTRLDTREGEKDLYRLARQRDGDGKDVQQVRVIKDRDGRVLASEESVQRRWKEYFEELMNEENEREKRVEGVNSVEQKVDKIRKDEVRKALKRMKSGKAVGPDDIPVEVWKCLGEAAVEFLANLFNRVLESERMPEEWRRSVLVPIFKNKGDVQSCSNYRGIKLMSHTMKVWERVVEARLRKVVDICEQQYGFMPRKSTTDAIFALRILMEKYRDGQRELHCVFVDLEKAYDRVPREELWYCMRKSGVAEKYVRVVQDMYERSRTVVRCAVGQTEEFNVEVGLHQGSALSPFLFAIVMDQLSEEVRQESPWTMMFADDIVICSESREQVEENLERWRFALERRGMKVSGSKTEYMCVNEREGSGTVRLQGEEVKKVQEFKYLGSTVQSNGECGKEVKKRVQAGWNGWRKVWGVLCERKISARIKGKVYRTVVRAAMLYGLETVSLRKRQESELEVAELKMLRFSLGVTRLDRIRNEYIRGTAHVGRLGDKVKEDRLRWFGHVQRRESEYIGRRMLDMELPGRRQRGRPKRRKRKSLMDMVSHWTPGVSSVQKARVLLVGAVGAGKSSFFNSINSVFKGHVSFQANTGTAGTSLTTQFRVYSIKANGKFLPLMLCDSMGLEEGLNAGLDIDDFSNILKGHIQDRYQFNPTMPLQLESKYFCKAPTIKEKIHAVVYVMDACKVKLLSDKMIEKLAAFRRKASLHRALGGAALNNPQLSLRLMMGLGEMERWVEVFPGFTTNQSGHGMLVGVKKLSGVPQMVLLTKVDEACRSVGEDLKHVYQSPYIYRMMQEVSVHLGVSLSAVVPVKNYFKELELDLHTDLVLLNAVVQIIRTAEGYFDDFSCEEE